MAWIFRRILVAAGFAHANEFVHGAVVPEHVLIHPAEHGLMLVDWVYQTAPDEPLRAVPRRYRSWYPEAALAKEPAGAALDVLFAVRCAQFLLGADEHWLLPEQTPEKLRAFFSFCSSKRGRSGDAWGVLHAFDELIGPREYRPLRMPGTDTPSETPSSGGPSAAPTRERG